MNKTADTSNKDIDSNEQWIAANRLRINRELKGATAKCTIGEAIDSGSSVKYHENENESEQ